MPHDSDKFDSVHDCKHSDLVLDAFQNLQEKYKKAAIMAAKFVQMFS